MYPANVNKLRLQRARSFLSAFLRQCTYPGWSYDALLDCWLAYGLMLSQKYPASWAW